MPSEVPVFSLWSDFVGWILDCTEKFPKKVRFTFSTRIDNLALDVLENIVRARYVKEKDDYLKAAHLDLNILRVLIRLACERHFLSKHAYEYAALKIDEAGRMIGGWQRSRQ